MCAEPGFGNLVIGANGFDLAPELDRVVHLPGMHEFVEDDVIADKRRRLDEAPIQRDGAAAGAGTPAGALVADTDSGDGATVGGGECERARGKFGGGQAPKMARDGGAQVGGDIGHAEELIGKLDAVGIAVAREGDPFAAEIDFGAELPIGAFNGTGGEFGELAGEPIGVARGELAAFGNRAAARDGQTRGAIRRQAEQVASRTVAADDAERDGAAVDKEMVR